MARAKRQQRSVTARYRDHYAVFAFLLAKPAIIRGSGINHTYRRKAWRKTARATGVCWWPSSRAVVAKWRR